jgi:hypothetical protein
MRINIASSCEQPAFPTQIAPELFANLSATGREFALTLRVLEKFLDQLRSRAFTFTAVGRAFHSDWY